MLEILFYECLQPRLKNKVTKFASLNSQKKMLTHPPDRGGWGGDMWKYNEGRKVAMQVTTQHYNYAGHCDGLQARQNFEE